MMNNLTWDDIKEDIHYEEVISRVRDFWYGYIEGFFIISNSYKNYSDLLHYLQRDLPPGWSLSFDFDGTIHAFYILEEHATQLSIQKDSHGKEYLQFSPTSV